MDNRGKRTARRFNKMSPLYASIPSRSSRGSSLQSLCPPNCLVPLQPAGRIQALGETEARPWAEIRGSAVWRRRQQPFLFMCILNKYVNVRRQRIRDLQTSTPRLDSPIDGELTLSPSVGQPLSRGCMNFHPPSQFLGNTTAAPLTSVVSSPHLSPPPSPPESRSLTARCNPQQRQLRGGQANFERRQP